MGVPVINPHPATQRFPLTHGPGPRPTLRGPSWFPKGEVCGTCTGRNELWFCSKRFPRGAPADAEWSFAGVACLH